MVICLVKIINYLLRTNFFIVWWLYGFVMFLELSKKRILTILIICFLLSLSTGTLLYDVHKPHNLYIHLKSISWPPDRYTLGNTSEYIYTSFGFDLTFEIWNPSNREYVFATGGSNLLDPQMKIELEENYIQLQ